MEVSIEASWKKILQNEFRQDYFLQLENFLKEEYNKETIYPSRKEIFQAFELCPFDSTRVVILGQDPYHGYQQAHGLCFSVNEGIKSPPSLVNIFKELHSDLGLPIPIKGNLSKWASQGILMLNATLTVQAAKPGSHQKKGWEQFTDAVISRLSEKKENLVFLLWGAYAQHKGEIIDRNKHLVLESAHPSPFSVRRGFFGNKHFSKTNNFLIGKKLKFIEW
jgi:uracil-DNA glycosylase